MFYCFVYPESIDQMLLEYFDKDTEESIVEIMKYRINDAFYICKSHVSSMYLLGESGEDGTGKRTYSKKIENCGDIQNTIGNESLVRKFEVRLHKFGTRFVEGTLPWECCDPKMDFLVGKIFSGDGKRMGNFLIYNDNRTKRVLADILKKYEITEIEPTGDMCLDMISLLSKLDKV